MLFLIILPDLVHTQFFILIRNNILKDCIRMAVAVHILNTKQNAQFLLWVIYLYYNCLSITYCPTAIKGFYEWQHYSILINILLHITMVWFISNLERVRAIFNKNYDNIR